jgi:hypothetical protein
MRERVLALEKELRDTRFTNDNKISSLESQVWLESARRRMDKAFEGLEARLSKRRKRKH